MTQFSKTAYYLLIFALSSVDFNACATDLKVADKLVFPQSQEECEKGGGHWNSVNERIADPTIIQCSNFKLPDAGKPCSDVVECTSGACISTESYMKEYPESHIDSKNDKRGRCDNYLGFEKLKNHCAQLIEFDKAAPVSHCYRPYSIQNDSQ